MHRYIHITRNMLIILCTSVLKSSNISFLHTCTCRLAVQTTQCEATVLFYDGKLSFSLVHSNTVLCPKHRRCLVRLVYISSKAAQVNFYTSTCIFNGTSGTIWHKHTHVFKTTISNLHSFTQQVANSNSYPLILQHWDDITSQSGDLLCVSCTVLKM